MSDRYILEGKTPVLCDDLMAWARWLDKAEIHVAHEKRGDVTVSTVFLGIDHAFGGSVPMLFETMIFGGKHDEYQERCSTWDEAEQMHKRACELAFRD
jgi:hypothetical protein